MYCSCIFHNQLFLRALCRSLFFPPSPSIAIHSSGVHPCFCTQNSFQLQNFVSPPLFLLLLPSLGGRGSVVKEKRDLKVRGRAGCNTAKTTELLYSSAGSTIACTPSYFAPVQLSRVLVIRFPHYRRHKGGERSSSHAALPHCPQPNFTQLSTFYFATAFILYSHFLFLLLSPFHHFLRPPLSERADRKDHVGTQDPASSCIWVYTQQCQPSICVQC